MYDEPFAGLDPISMGVTATLIPQLNNALGSTTILVSHDVHETFVIADYVYFLSQGRSSLKRYTEEGNVGVDRSLRETVCARRT